MNNRVKCPQCHGNSAPSKTPKWKPEVKYYCPNHKIIYTVGDTNE